MGSSMFILLFLLGVLLAILGGIIGVVDAFNVSPGWGLLALFVPFALLFFCIKFWDRRRWARNSLVLGLLGLLSMVLSWPFLQELTVPLLQKGLVSQPEVPPTPDSGTLPVAEAPGQVFTKPFVPAAAGFSAIARANLIQSTDADVRRRQVNGNRLDPYATVPIPPAPKANLLPGGQSTSVARPQTPVAPVSLPPPSVLTPPIAKQPATGTDATGQSVASRPALQAEKIQVTGVINLGGNSYAIVQSADSATPSYVKVGQRLANGQILVKRIELHGQSPSVIFEEKGQEISRPVG
ncbi:MAG: hypothetical protein KGQ93_13475 [Cyanobacteria bacterium REEB459]|nr:hypothetical protein [Cyanobacteria bacterium REEB459]